MSTASTPRSEEFLERQVTQLLAQWRAETAYLSSSTERHAHPAYQALINMGDAALPFLLSDLEKSGDGHLSKALAAITGAHPVPAEARGNIQQIAEAWLRWAHENGLRS